MAAVTVDSGPIAAEDYPESMPQSRWPDLLRVRRTFLDIRLPHDCRILVRFREEADLMYQALGFSNADELVRAGYGLEPGQINAAVEWLKHNRPQKAIGLGDIPPLRKRPGQPRKEEKNDGNNIILRGSNRFHWLARLERDAESEPTVAVELERVRSGESSPHAAAVRLGWRSPRHCKTCHCFEETP